MMCFYVLIVILNGQIHYAGDYKNSESCNVAGAEIVQRFNARYLCLRKD